MSFIPDSKAQDSIFYEITFLDSGIRTPVNGATQWNEAWVENVAQTVYCIPQAMRWFWNGGTNYISVKFIIFFKLGIVQPKLNNKFPTYLTQAALEHVTILIYFTSFLHKTFGNNGHPSSLELKLGP